MDTPFNAYAISDLLINIAANTILVCLAVLIRRWFPKTKPDTLALVAGVVAVLFLLIVLYRAWLTSVLFSSGSVVPVGLTALAILAITVLLSPEMLPRGSQFHFIFLLAIGTAVVGGIVWNTIFRGTLGGRLEPHGSYAMLWAFITNFPSVITLVLLNVKYRYLQQKDQLVLYSAYLVGLTMGSYVFYDIPLAGTVGVRWYLDALNVSPVSKEIVLVLTWSSLLSLGFMLLAAVKVLLVPPSRIIPDLVLPCLKQIALCISVTTLAVIVFLLPFQSRVEELEAARGIVAGVALRTSLFFGLLAASRLKYYSRDVVNARV